MAGGATNPNPAANPNAAPHPPAAIAVPGARPPAGALHDYWDRPVSALATVCSAPTAAPDQERHRIYALLLMALVHYYWNGNKYGPLGDYALRLNQLDGMHTPPDLYEGGEYLGHNIAALAVDGSGSIVDFDFNHNDLFNSSMEHAEARLLRRVYALAQLPGAAGGAIRAKLWQPPTYPMLLKDYTVYTSLESCAQCSGIMALAQVKSVVYLQHDPGQNYIGNILHNFAQTLPNAKMLAPLPIAGAQFGFAYATDLDAAYAAFVDEMGRPGAYFFQSAGRVTRNDSITSFLCTDRAREIYKQARHDFEELTKDPARLAHGGYAPSGGLTNEEVLAAAAAFFGYATARGRRGTPHGS